LQEPNSDARIWSSRAAVMEDRRKEMEMSGWQEDAVDEGY
jgi:hypothetical protein